jgi:hypothetical protein
MSAGKCKACGCTIERMNASSIDRQLASMLEQMPEIVDRPGESFDSWQRRQSDNDRKVAITARVRIGILRDEIAGYCLDCAPTNRQIERERAQRKEQGARLAIEAADRGEDRDLEAQLQSRLRDTRRDLEAMRDRLKPKPA